MPRLLAVKTNQGPLSSSISFPHYSHSLITGLLSFTLTHSTFVSPLRFPMRGHIPLCQPRSFLSSLGLIFFNPSPHIWTKNPQVLLKNDSLSYLFLSLDFWSHPPLVQTFDLIIGLSDTLTRWHCETPEALAISLLRYIVLS